MLPLSLATNVLTSLTDADTEVIEENVRLNQVALDKVGPDKQKQQHQLKIIGKSPRRNQGRSDKARTYLRSIPRRRIKWGCDSIEYGDLGNIYIRSPDLRCAKYNC